VLPVKGGRARCGDSHEPWERGVTLVVFRDIGGGPDRGSRPTAAAWLSSAGREI
jgi:hypothetical protein